MKTTILAALVVALAGNAQAAGLELLTENNAPNTYADGDKVAGAAADAVRELLAKAGVEGSMKVVKWKDAYAGAQAKKNTCAFGTARLANREALFKWYGPVGSNTWALYALPTFDKKVAKARDARFHKIGAVKNDAKVDFMRAEGASSIREAENDADNPARLASAKTDPNHIDLWITTAATARDVAAKAGVKDLKEVLVVKKQDLYLACNPRTDKAILQKLDAAAKKS